MAVQQMQKPVRDYLDIFGHHPAELLGSWVSNAVWGYRKGTLNTTWEISYAAIQARAPEAADLLDVLSFLHFSNIHEDIIYQWSSESPSKGTAAPGKLSRAYG